MISALRAFNRRMKQQYESDELFHSNEVQANMLLMKVLWGNAVILVLILAAVEAGVFPVSGAIVPMVVRAIAYVLVLWIISRKVRQDAWWLKYLLLLGILAVYARIDAMLTHKVAILIVLPALCSSRYFSNKLTVKMALLTAVVFFFTTIEGAYHGWINMNDVMVEPGSTFTNTGVWLGSGIEETLDRAQYVRNTLLFTYVPKLMMLGLAAVICENIARRGRRMVEEQKELSESSTRMETELRMATQIQEGMLPNIYPPFPDRKEFDIYGTMNPAREVGGDFFDFFLVDDDHLAMTVADVSGKGVPAALFMMASKIILAKVDMFVTVWVGILEISTGILRAANAGHEFPALKCGERFELLRDKHGLVIGALKGVRYTEYTVQLQRGDKIFLYTDGVPEATNSNNELFGTRRMIEALNQAPDAAPKEILSNVKRSVDRFVGKAEQFDDLTMLCFSYR